MASAYFVDEINITRVSELAGKENKTYSLMGERQPWPTALNPVPEGRVAARTPGGAKGTSFSCCHFPLGPEWKEPGRRVGVNGRAPGPGVLSS